MIVESELGFTIMVYGRESFGELQSSFLQRLATSVNISFYIVWRTQASLLLLAVSYGFWVFVPQCPSLGWAILS